MSEQRGVWAPSHRSDVQGLRGVAVLVVVLYHARVPGFEGGFVGVDVFFAISGFVISRLLLAELDATGRVSLRQFYIRRARRLLPALAVTLVGVLLLSIGLAGVAGQRTAARTGAAAGLMNANTYLALFGTDGGYFDVDAAANPLLHTWSLSVEEQFYLLFPALLVGTWAVARRAGWNEGRSVATILCFVGASSMCLAISMTEGVWNPGGLADEIAFYSMPTRAWEFAAGALLAAWVRRGEQLGLVPSGRQRRAAIWIGVIGVGLVAGATTWFGDSTTFPGIAAALPVGGVVLVMAAGSMSGAASTDAETLVGRALSWRPLTWLGDVSYGWYLWHWPAMVFAVAWWPTTSHVRLVAGVASLGIAALSLSLIEHPLRIRRSTMQRTVALAIVCAVLPLGGALALERSHQSIIRSDVYESLGEHADRLSACDRSGPDLPLDGDTCTWPPTDTVSVGTAVLVGDSNAGHFSEGFIEAAGSVGLTARIATRNGCPFVPLSDDRDIGSDGCSDHVARTVEALLRLRPELVVIASASDLYLGDSDPSAAPSLRSGVLEDAPLSDAWASGLDQLSRQLTDAGIAVVIVHTVPRFPSGWSPRLFAPLRLRSPGGLSDLRVDRDHQERRRRRAYEIEQSVARSGVVTLDLFPQLCDATRCPAYRNDEWLYRDASHLSVPASRTLAPAFADAMQGAMTAIGT